MIDRVLVVGAVGLVGWYLYQRMTAGNRYAGDQGGAVTFPLIDNKNPDDGSLFGSLGDAWDQITGGGALQPLNHFEPSEFREWWPLMSTGLLQKLDRFRDRLGFAVQISPATGALGRRLGASLSQHNVDLWGEVRAVDVMPEWPNGGTPAELERAYRIAREVGFSGIGVYPDWRPRPGLHLDVRSGPLALWSGYLENEKQVYGAIGAVWS